MADVVYKLVWKHHVTTDEVEEVFINKPRYKVHERGNVKGEDPYTAYGRTNAGRYLRVFFIYKTSCEALIVTARDMDRAADASKKERKRYAR